MLAQKTPKTFISMEMIAPNCAKALLWGKYANQVHALRAQN